MDKVKIRMYREPGVQAPTIAYGGTSAAFDLVASEDTRIPAKAATVVPTGIRLSIDENEPYYMTIHLRSSLGFKRNLQNHIGIVDAGYTGDFGIKVFNWTDDDVAIAKGERFAQVLVHRKFPIEFEDLNKEEFENFASTQGRGNGGFGSSGKQ